MGAADRASRTIDPGPAGRNQDGRAVVACYLATSAAGAAVEAFQDFGRGVLPVSELRARARAEVIAPNDSPRAAQLNAARARAVGVSQALWAGADRSLTQRWAVALHRAGWLALWHGIQHDPTGQSRSVTLFDTAGHHPPYDDADGWNPIVTPLDRDRPTIVALARFGIRVIPDPEPETIPLDETGLL